MFFCGNNSNSYCGYIWLHCVLYALQSTWIYIYIIFQFISSTFTTLNFQCIQLKKMLRSIKLYYYYYYLVVYFSNGGFICGQMERCFSIRQIRSDGRIRIQHRTRASERLAITLHASEFTENGKLWCSLLYTSCTRKFPFGFISQSHRQLFKLVRIHLFPKTSPRFSAFAFFLTTFNVNLIIDYLNSLPLHFQSLRPALKLLDEVPSMDDDEAMTVCEQLLQTMIIFVTECMGSVCLNKGPNLIVRITFWATLNHCHYPCYWIIIYIIIIHSPSSISVWRVDTSIRVFTPKCFARGTREFPSKLPRRLSRCGSWELCAVWVAKTGEVLARRHRLCPRSFQVKLAELMEIAK